MIKQGNKVIIGVIIIAVIVFAVVQGVIIPQKNLKEQQYLANQQDPTTHDVANVLKYKNKYMGNASNIGNLFSNLPLSDIERAYQLYPETFAVEVNYKETVFNIGEERVNKSLIYNSVAAFALIDNLEKLHYNFTGDSYTTTRSQMQQIFGEDLSKLIINEEKWKTEVQNKLNDNKFVDNCIKRVFVK